MPPMGSRPPPDCGIPATPELTPNPQANYANGNNPFYQNTMSQPPPSLQTSVAINDIRGACQSAQNRIMRLQQATNTQAGITSAIREGWFEELRHVAQCFITAQQASAKLEQAINTERAQLQGALSSALNERDVTRSERDAARQEVHFLRSRLSELTATAPPLATISWADTPSEKSNQSRPNSPEDNGWLSGSPGDLLHNLPSKVEDMPFSPVRQQPTSQYPYILETPDKPQQSKAMVHPNYKQNERSKFFNRDQGPVPPKGNYNESQNSGGQYGGSQHNGSQYNSSQYNNQHNGNQQNGRQYNPNQHAANQHVTNQHNENHFSMSAKAPEFNGGNANHHNNGPVGVRTSRTPFSGQQGPFAPPRGYQDMKSRSNTPAVGMHPRSHSRHSQRSFTPTPMPMQQRQVLPPPEGAPPMPAMDMSLVSRRYQTFNEYAAGVPSADKGDEERTRDIFQFFNQITDWVTRYCSMPNKKLISDMEKLFPRLWDYACSATYPNHPSNAASHSLFMLSSDEYRKYFLSRLVIQYVVQQMWSPQSWEGVDDDLTEVLMSVKHRLDPKYGYDAVVQLDERHVLVEKRSRAIYEFMRQPAWVKVKSQKISLALTRFKDIVGPLMNKDHSDRDRALHELSTISENALRLSALLNTSRLSFQFIFNECGIKFSDQSHRPLNASLPVRELQSHHWRLMCVVTPGITYRNEAGSSVEPRFLAKANVLLMQ